MKRRNIEELLDIAMTLSGIARALELEGEQGKRYSSLLFTMSALTEKQPIRLCKLVDKVTH